MTWLLAIASSKTQMEVDAGLLPDLVDAADNMIRGNVVVTPAEWMVLSDLERKAWVIASEAVDIARGSRIAGMIGNPDLVAEIMEPLDGGRARADLALRREMEKLHDDLRGGKAGIKA